MVQEMTTSTAAEEQGVPACRHHWVIQPATGPVSQGVCQSCGEVREFKNYIEVSPWGDERLTARAQAESSVAAVRAAAGYVEGPEEE